MREIKGLLKLTREQLINIIKEMEKTEMDYRNKIKFLERQIR